MAVFEWSDKYSVGNGTMDDHHKRLFDILNILLDAMKSGRGEEILEDQLNELASYAKYHFSEEERLMQVVNYPGLSAQQQSHKAFIDTVVSYQAKVTEGHGLYIISEVVTTIKEWLKKHILEMDMHYEGYLSDALKKSA